MSHLLRAVWNYSQMPGAGDRATWPQAPFHGLDPRADDDDGIDASEEAEDEFLSTPAFVADWLADECHGKTAAESIAALSERDEDTLSVPQLLALLFGAYGNDSTRALYALRQRFVAGNRDGLRDRAAEIEREAA